MDLTHNMTDAPHIHRWRIDTPAGPTVQGRCGGCGAERTYDVHVADIDGKTYHKAGHDATIRKAQRAEAVAGGYLHDLGDRNGIRRER